ncbi:hypothetical protein GYB22_03580 [bacterium]|nr:hypothetical protein [bacterium]
MKFEKEIRVDRAEVPDSALMFIDSCDFKKKVKWYKEIGLDTLSYEAKVKHSKKRYSIEFSADGSLEDVEIDMKSKHLPSKTMRNIDSTLCSKFEDYSIVKTQVQFVGETQQVLNFIKSNVDTAVDKNYELVIAVKEDHAYVKYEYLFDAEGSIIHWAKIVIKNEDYIEY